MTRLEPVHPGEVLKHDFLDPFGLSATALARSIGVTPTRVDLAAVAAERHDFARQRDVMKGHRSP